MRLFVILNNHLFHDIGHSYVVTEIEAYFTVIPFSVRIDFCAVMLQTLYEFCLTKGGFFFVVIFFIAFLHFSIRIVVSNMGCENLFS